MTTITLFFVLAAIFLIGGWYLTSITNQPFTPIAAFHRKAGYIMLFIGGCFLGSGIATIL